MVYMNKITKFTDYLESDDRKSKYSYLRKLISWHEILFRKIEGDIFT